MILSGKVALVTGGARRLGRAITQGLAAAKADIAIHHHDSAEQAEEVANSIRAAGMSAEVFQADLTDPAQISDLFTRFEERFERLDILVNNAAAFERKPALEITPEAWDRLMNLNLRAPFLCSQLAARLMERIAGGVIINIADVAAFQAWPGYAHYNVSKAGLVMMTRVLARALAPGIRVNAVAPGPVLPPDDTTPAESARLADMRFLERPGSPDDVVQAILYLATAQHVTGQTLIVDGGKTLKT